MDGLIQKLARRLKRNALSSQQPHPLNPTEEEPISPRKHAAEVPRIATPPLGPTLQDTFKAAEVDSPKVVTAESSDCQSPRLRLPRHGSAAPSPSPPQHAPLYPTPRSTTPPDSHLEQTREEPPSDQGVLPTPRSTTLPESHLEQAREELSSGQSLLLKDCDSHDSQGSDFVVETSGPLTPFRVEHAPPKSILKAPRVRFSGFPEEILGLESSLPPPPHFPGREVHLPYAPMAATRALLPQPAPPSPPPPPRPPPNEGPHPPSLFTSKIEVDEYLSETAYLLYVRFMKELSDFVELQGEVTRKRLAVQEMRTELGRLRDIVSRCDLEFFDYVRQCVTNQSNFLDSTLRDLFEAAQVARDLVGPMEADYEPTEVELGAEEHKLLDKYADLERRFEHFFRLNTEPTRQSMPAESIEYESSTHLSDSVKEPWETYDTRNLGLLHGHAIGDNVMVGQVPRSIEEEAHTALTDVNQSYLRPSLDTMDRISDLGIPSVRHHSTTTPDDMAPDEFLVDLFGIVGARLDSSMPYQDLETRVGMISETLEGVASHPSFDECDILDLFPDDSPVDMTLQEGETLLLLDEEEISLSTLSDYLMRFTSTPDRINKWILHQLRVSRREAYALQRCVALYSPYQSDWAVASLMEWPNDDLGSTGVYRQGSIESVNEELELGNTGFYRQGHSESISEELELHETAIPVRVRRVPVFGMD